MLLELASLSSTKVADEKSRVEHSALLEDLTELQAAENLLKLRKLEIECNRRAKVQKVEWEISDMIYWEFKRSKEEEEEDAKPLAPLMVR